MLFPISGQPLPPGGNLTAATLFLLITHLLLETKANFRKKAATSTVAVIIKAIRLLGCFRSSMDSMYGSDLAVKSHR